VAATAVGLVLATACGAATYYVCSSDGSDSAAGTRPAAAWRSLAKLNATRFIPGDTILLQSGSTWTGQLWPKGSGAPGRPIVIDVYGGTVKPAIHGGGLYDEAVTLRNQSYWELNNLEVTNTGTTRGLRAGIRVWSVDSGTVRRVVIRGMYVHDVNGPLGTEGKQSGGIAIVAGGTTIPSNFDSVLIENCLVHRTDRTGIWTSSVWRNRGGQTAGPGAWFPSTNVIIRGNVVDSAGGDGIVVRVCREPRIEGNLVKHAASLAKEWVAGIWPFNCDDALFQYNEACSTHTTMDGQGFDADWMCRRTVFQYNYSHDNEGGFMLVCCEGASSGNFNDSAVIRFNVSVNDGAKVFKIAGTPTNALVHNNTVYTRHGSSGTLVNVEAWNGMAGRTSFVNNIFMMEGSYALNAPGTNAHFSHNLWYGIAAPSDSHAITAHPQLTLPGNAPMGRENLQGYRITRSSPALGSALQVDGGVVRDFWGNDRGAASVQDRGAHQLGWETSTGSQRPPREQRREQQPGAPAGRKSQAQQRSGVMHLLNGRMCSRVGLATGNHALAVARP